MTSDAINVGHEGTSLHPIPSSSVYGVFIHSLSLLIPMVSIFFFVDSFAVLDGFLIELRVYVQGSRILLGRVD